MNDKRFIDFVTVGNFIGVNSGIMGGWYFVRVEEVRQKDRDNRGDYVIVKTRTQHVSNQTINAMKLYETDVYYTGKMLTDHSWRFIDSKMNSLLDKLLQ